MALPMLPLLALLALRTTAATFAAEASPSVAARVRFAGEASPFSGALTKRCRIGRGEQSGDCLLELGGLLAGLALGGRLAPLECASKVVSGGAKRLAPPVPPPEAPGAGPQTF
mmetsp:Transcript_9622/g.20424  ORF Transcript_9622/g.20424 Transcript_9622/m.20424 type:complete len:113 (+) Transcript_9622:1130-1468(+)